MTINEFIHSKDFMGMRIDDVDDILEMYLQEFCKEYDEHYAHGAPFHIPEDMLEYMKEGVKKALNTNPQDIKMHPRTLNRIRRVYCT